MRPRYIVSILTCTCVLAAGVRAEEEVERFILPETPPTIERLKRSPLDQPLLKKQNFVTDPEIMLPPILLTFNFQDFSPRPEPIKTGLYHGSYARALGFFDFYSKRNFRVTGKLESRDGENEKLAGESRDFGFRMMDSFGGTSVYYAEVRLDEKTVWTQKKRSYGAASGIDIPVRSNIGVEANVSCFRGEIADVEANNAFFGDFMIGWQPFSGHNIELGAAGSKDDVFELYDDFTVGRARYHFVFFEKAVAGAGCDSYSDRAYPYADFTWLFQPRMKFKAVYSAGYRKPLWSKLYFNGMFLTTNRNIKFPEAVSSFTEEFSYYVDENNFLRVEAVQSRWNDFIYWQYLPQTGGIGPGNITGVYTSGWKISYNQKSEVLFSVLNMDYNTHHDVPFVAEYGFGALAGVVLGGWTVSSGYEYIAPSGPELPGTARIEGTRSLSASVKKSFGYGAEVSLSGENLLGDTVETQPGFTRTSPEFLLGLNVRF
ncbi:MAG: hypothetical protein JW803_06280 [Endomicrobiales bacterium]|nr:hypothetical protein [Endomicrobiales bacterium]